MRWIVDLYLTWLKVLSRLNFNHWGQLFLEGKWLVSRLSLFHEITDLVLYEWGVLFGWQTNFVGWRILINRPLKTAIHFECMLFLLLRGGMELFLEIQQDRFTVQAVFLSLWLLLKEQFLSLLGLSLFLLILRTILFVWVSLTNALFHNHVIIPYNFVLDLRDILILQVLVESVFDLRHRPAQEQIHLWDLRPLRSNLVVHLKDELVLLGCPFPPNDWWVNDVVPSFPALPAKSTGEIPCDDDPVLRTVVVDLLSQDPILFFGPLIARAYLLDLLVLS